MPDQLSPDGQWRWTGAEWVPVEPAPPHAAEPAWPSTFDEEMRGAVRLPPRSRRATDADRQVPAAMRGEVLTRLRRRVHGQRRIAVISRKGGVGKTTTTLMMGHVLAYARGDRIIALDANPDAGSLAHRLERETELSINDLLRQPGPIPSYVAMRRFTSQAESRLEVLASDQDPLLSEGLGPDHYARAMDMLRLHYGIVLCDSGTGVLDPSTQGILALADQVVICTSAALDAYRAVLRTLDWLETHGHAALARNGVVVVNAVQPGTAVDVATMELELSGRCRRVLRVPWDEKLYTGAETGLAELREDTQRAYVAIASAVVDGFDDDAGAAVPAPDPVTSVAGPDGRMLDVEVVSWRGGTALVGRDPESGREYGLEIPDLIRGGRDVEGRWLLVHRTRRADATIRVARVRSSADTPVDLLPAIDLSGLDEEAAPGGGPVYLLEAWAGRRPVRVLMSVDPPRVLGVDVGADMSYRPVPFTPEQVNVPGLVDRGLDAAGRAVGVVETDLRLIAATVVTDEHGIPAAIDLPGIPEAFTLTF